MLWIKSGTRAPLIPTASVSPEQSKEDCAPGRLSAEAFNLIDVWYLKGGLWKAVCECGEAPHVFAQERAAWQWITAHKCPVLESDSRPV
jgi:hypothetical protein